MPNAIKFSSIAQTLALREGRFWIATGDVAKGETSVTDYWNGITPPAGGYTIYLNKASQGPSIYVATSDDDLIYLTNIIAGTNYSTVDECLSWYLTQTDKMVLDRDYESIITGELILNLDSGFAPSYPRSGNIWYDLSYNSYNGLLVNGPVYSSLNGGCIIFDGSNDYITVNSGSNILSNVNYTKIAWFYVTSFLTANNIISSSGGGQHAFWLAGGNRLQAGHNGNWSTVISTSTLSLNTWYFGAVTFNTTTGWNLYLNGSLESTSTNTAAFTGTGDISVGSFWQSNNFKGRISISQVYKRVLTSTEISQNFNAQRDRFEI